MKRHWLAAILGIFVLSAVAGNAKVARVSFDELAKGSDTIVIGKIIETQEIEGVTVARVQVGQVLKGPNRRELTYLAQPTWICDITSAVRGETVLLFLYKERKFDSSMPDDGFISFGYPKKFEDSLKKVGINELYGVMHSGCGRMPIRSINGELFATLWVGDVQLPQDIQTVAGPGKKYSFIRSIRLADLLRMIQPIANEQGK